ncbi:MAG: hypothetical protein A2Z20_10540 [Bdellovibrionales bacterium RBG_16_40_8]|nr:MAG: hypothetical protein A2Z20_10540 [Bdellovibrionales bacterium RBG_16_40_8]
MALYLVIILLSYSPATWAKKGLFSLSVTGYYDRSRLSRTSTTGPSFTLESMNGYTALGNVDINLAAKYSLFVSGGTSLFDYESTASRIIHDNRDNFINASAGMKFFLGDLSLSLYALHKPIIIFEDVTSSENNLIIAPNTYGTIGFNFGATSRFYDLAIGLAGGTSVSSPSYQDKEIDSKYYLQGSISVRFGRKNKTVFESVVGTGTFGADELLYGFDVRLREDSYEYNNDIHRTTDFGGGIFILLQ